MFLKPRPEQVEIRGEVNWNGPNFSYTLFKMLFSSIFNSVSCSGIIPMATSSICVPTYYHSLTLNYTVIFSQSNSHSRACEQVSISLHRISMAQNAEWNLIQCTQSCLHKPSSNNLKLEIPPCSIEQASSDALHFNCNRNYSAHKCLKRLKITIFLQPNLCFSQIFLGDTAPVLQISNSLKIYTTRACIHAL